MATFNLDPQHLLIPGPAGQLALRLQAGDAAGALAELSAVAVIAHPHPQHGGSMTNKVVATLARAYQQLGVATVCFNFRGVGDSAGHFDQGVGERDDVLAVAHWAQAALPDAPLLLAGFSFGSAMVAAASWELPASHLALVAPPIERYGYDRAGRFSCPCAVIIGAEDEVVDVAGVSHWALGIAPPIDYRCVPGTGHFFHGQLRALRQWLSDVLPIQLTLPDAMN